MKIYTCDPNIYSASTSKQVHRVSFFLAASLSLLSFSSSPISPSSSLSMCIDLFFSFLLYSVKHCQSIVIEYCAQERRRRRGSKILTHLHFFFVCKCVLFFLAICGTLCFTHLVFYRGQMDISLALSSLPLSH